MRTRPGRGGRVHGNMTRVIAGELPTGMVPRPGSTASPLPRPGRTGAKPGVIQAGAQVSKERVPPRGPRLAPVPVRPRVKALSAAGPAADRNVLRATGAMQAARVPAPESAPAAEECAGAAEAVAVRSLSDLGNRSENLAGRGQISSILKVNSRSID